jgi:gamma-glutamylputrescine oxidase
MRTAPYWIDDHLPALPVLERDVTADAVVVGGGIAGLTVAQLLAQRGARVIVVEATRCGGRATGRSSGFITPDSELQTTQLVHRFGVAVGARLWRAAASACDHIRQTIAAFDISCDLVEADSLYIATGASARQTIQDEHEARLQAGLQSSYVAPPDVSAALGARGFDAAVRYGGTFAMTAYRYVVELRDRLAEIGVRIHEHSPVVAAEDERVVTERASVRAGRIFFCADRDLACLGNRRSAAHYAQTFLAATGPLPTQVMQELFPSGDLLVWDSDLLYHYFRRTADDRLLIGGSLRRNLYGPPAQDDAGANDLRSYVEQRLPALAAYPFTHAWSGLIGVTKDLLPMAGRDRSRRRHFYAGCASGLPWSVLAAQCSVNASEGGDELEPFFDPYRAFTDLDPLQYVARKRVTFALSHAYAKAALRGTAGAIRRRRPYVLAAAGGAAALIIAAARGSRRITRRGPSVAHTPKQKRP